MRVVFSCTKGHVDNSFGFQKRISEILRRSLVTRNRYLIRSSWLFAANKTACFFIRSCLLSVANQVKFHQVENSGLLIYIVSNQQDNGGN
jgi:hypothetical protein